MTIGRIHALEICLLGLVLGGCGAQPGNNHNNWNLPDAAPQCVPDDDDDGDGIPNGIEGCLEGRNTDGDEYPDWLDTDSDDDGCPDEIEDLNGDGLVGSCRTTCPNLDPAECGPGQACLANGHCDPPIAFECSDGETSTTVADTDYDGVVDCAPGVCLPVGPGIPDGRPAGQFHTSPAGKLQIVVWDDAVLQEQFLHNAGGEDCANGVDDNADARVDCDDPECRNTSACGGVSVTFDLDDPNRYAPTAGFAVTRRPLTSTIEDERTLVFEELRQVFDASHVTVRDEGQSRILLDEYPSVMMVEVQVDATTLTTASELRNRLVTAMAGRAPGEITGLPAPFGTTTDQFVLAMTLQWRAPAVGDPHVILMGAVAPRSKYDDPTSDAALHVADVANGSGLAEPGRPTTAHCEATLALVTGPADILWIVDDSPAAFDARTGLAAAATQFYNRAATYGLDFRMGVTNMHIGNNGILCTNQAQSNDFFLGAGNLSELQACLLQPAGSLTPAITGANHGITQGYNAIVNHLPRANQPNRIRPGAQLVLIYVSTEAAQEVQNSCGTSSPDPACIQTEIQPTLNLLSGVSNPEAQGTAHAIVGPPPSGCSTATLGSGYIEIVTNTGGQIGAVCQSDPSATLQIILDELATNAGGVMLAHWPISVTLGVARDGVPQERSRVDGFAYDPHTNTLRLNPSEVIPANPVELVVGYERWLTP